METREMMSPLNQQRVRMATKISSIPVVERRLEVSFEIKGEGEVDAEVLNQFHGVTFGDEVEDDMPVSEESTEEGPHLMIQKN